MSAVATLICDSIGVRVLSALLLIVYLGSCDGILAEDMANSIDDNMTGPETIIPQGTVRGVHMMTRLNKTIFGFVGIPYAEPPLGNLRFRAPKPAKCWSGTLIANRIYDPIMCPQFNEAGIITGEEDCLYLHVYTPKHSLGNNSALLPVMVYIIGGAFQTLVNDPRDIGPDFLLDQDVLLVIPNFRIGVLGYLSTGDEVSPGNYALKDTVLALKWTQENIKYFGGDRNQVTLFGHSSGATMVHLLTLSKSTEGLFHKIITQSGSASAPRLQLPKNVFANRAVQLGEYLGCPTKSSVVLVDCLRKISVSEILNTNSALHVWQTYPSTLWGPTYELEMEGALLTDSPTNLIASGRIPDIPWMSTVSWDEGFLNAVPFYKDRDLFENFLHEMDTALPLVLDYKNIVADEAAYTAALKSYYLNDLSVNSSWLLDNITQLVGDATFTYPVYNAFKQQLRFAKSPRYFAAFKYRGTFSKTYSLSGGSTELTYVTHGDDLIYLFPYHNSVLAPSGSQPNEADLRMTNTMVQLWTSFAINGTPTTSESNVTWEPYSSLDNYLLIGNGPDAALVMEHDLFVERMQYWDELATAHSSACNHSLLAISIALCIYILSIV